MLMITFDKKVCLLGDFGVGKTSLVHRFVYNYFEDKYTSTVGVRVSRKVLSIARGADHVELGMVLWDIASDDNFVWLQDRYLQGATGAVLVCDLTRPETLHNLRHYVIKLLQINPRVFFVLATNKNDLVDRRQITGAQIEAFGAEFNISYYFTSAKTGAQVEELFNHLGQMIVG